MKICEQIHTSTDMTRSNVLMDVVVIRLKIG